MALQAPADSLEPDRSRSLSIHPPWDSCQRDPQKILCPFLRSLWRWRWGWLPPCLETGYLLVRQVTGAADSSYLLAQTDNAFRKVEGCLRGSQPSLISLSTFQGLMGPAAVTWRMVQVGVPGWSTVDCGGELVGLWGGSAGKLHLPKSSIPSFQKRTVLGWELAQATVEKLEPGLGWVPPTPCPADSSHLPSGLQPPLVPLGISLVSSGPWVSSGSLRRRVWDCPEGTRPQK